MPDRFSEGVEIKFISDLKSKLKSGKCGTLQTFFFGLKIFVCRFTFIV